MKLVSLIKNLLKTRIVGKYFMWCISNYEWSETESTLFSTLLSTCHRDLPNNREGLKFYGTHQILVCDDDVTILGEHTNI